MKLRSCWLNKPAHELAVSFSQFFVYIPTNSGMGYRETDQLSSSGQGLPSNVDSSTTPLANTEQHTFVLLRKLRIELPGCLPGFIGLIDGQHFPHHLLGLQASFLFKQSGYSFVPSLFSFFIPPS